MNKSCTCTVCILPGFSDVLSAMVPLVGSNKLSDSKTSLLILFNFSISCSDILGIFFGLSCFFLCLFFFVGLLSEPLCRPLRGSFTLEKKCKINKFILGKCFFQEITHGALELLQFDNVAGNLLQSVRTFQIPHGLHNEAGLRMMLYSTFIVPIDV